MRGRKILAVWAALVLLVSGCAPAAETGPAEAGGEAVSFTDDLGRELTVVRSERVAAIIGSFAVLWCLAGGRDSLAAAMVYACPSFDLGLG